VRQVPQSSPFRCVGTVRRPPARPHLVRRPRGPHRPATVPLAQGPRIPIGHVGGEDGSGGGYIFRFIHRKNGESFPSKLKPPLHSHPLATPAGILVSTLGSTAPPPNSSPGPWLQWPTPRCPSRGPGPSPPPPPPTVFRGRRTGPPCCQGADPWRRCDGIRVRWVFHQPVGQGAGGRGRGRHTLRRIADNKCNQHLSCGFVVVGLGSECLSKGAFCPS